MLNFTCSFISGMMLGIEFVSDSEIEGRDTDNFYVVLDILIVRFLITLVRD